MDNVNKLEPLLPRESNSSLRFGGRRFGSSPYHGRYDQGGGSFYRGYAYRAAPLYGGYNYGGRSYYGGQPYYGDNT
jgi:hypothetical protein